VGKTLTKAFRESLGNSGKNPSHPQKFACSYTYDLYRFLQWCATSSNFFIRSHQKADIFYQSSFFLHYLTLLYDVDQLQ